MSKVKSKQKEWERNYYIIIPVLLTLLIYLISLTFGFRNFDEDILIKNFYMPKTFTEYIEKFFLINSGGASEAHGFSFSGIKNVHVCFLGMPSIYLLAYLFKANPFLYHAWSLLLHSIAVIFLALFSYKFTQDKKIAMFIACAWTLHPTNVESIVWATNWLQCLGAIFYFSTLWWIASHTNKHTWQNTLIISFLTIIQIFFTEHTITIPIALFITTIYLLRNQKQEKIFKTAIKTTLPSFLIIFGYWLMRNFLIARAIQSSQTNNLKELIERVSFLTPQAFIHQFKLVFFPLKLTIDQIDLQYLDKAYLGSYHIICLLKVIIIAATIWFLRKSFPYLSYGLLMFTVTLLPFIQIIPLYSLGAERYNYFGSAFIAFGIIGTLFQSQRIIKAAPYIAILLCLVLGIRTELRIWDWKDSPSLFTSTINTSKSLFKKGIWTYNLAICQRAEDKKKELLVKSTQLLEEFIKKEEAVSTPQSSTLDKYELDSKSLLTKATDRIATNYEILNEKEKQLQYLNKALAFSIHKSQTQSLIYKNLGTYYFQEGDYKKSLDFYLNSYGISQNPTIAYAISVCYLKLNDKANYEQYLQQAASVVSPYNVSPFKTYGQFLELEKHDYKNASRYYKIASLLENNVEPYILLSSLYLKQSLIDKASEVIQNGLHSFPSNPTLLYFHGTINLSKGKISAGINDLVNIANKANTPNDIKIEACHILVDLFLKQGDPNKAKKYNDLILTINPGDKEAVKHRI